MEGACQKAAAVNERKESLSSELRGKQKKFRDAEVGGRGWWGRGESH